jgi:hypothetical protein
LDLVSDLLDWADYEAESKIDFFNAIDLFGIKRAILRSKLRRLEKNYPDVEGYQREELLKYLGLLETELNQDLRIAMSSVADSKVVNYTPTLDNERDPNKHYYYFEQADHSDGEVSRSFSVKEYTEQIFYKYKIDNVEYRLRVNPLHTNEESLASLIIYEFNGELIDLINDIEDAIEVVEDTNKAEVLKEVKAALEEMQKASGWSVLNPVKMANAY